MIPSCVQILRSNVAWLLIALACPGCANDPTVTSISSNPSVNSTKTAKQSNGPIELTVIVQPGVIQLSEEASLTISIRKPANMRVDFPNLAGQLDDFTIAGTSDVLPTMDGQLQIVQRVYQLQPKRAGSFSLVLPPVYFVLTGSKAETGNTTEVGNDTDVENNTVPRNDTEKQFVEVDPIELQVLSQSSSENASLGDLRKEIGPLDLPQSKTKITVLIAIAITAIVAVTALTFFLLGSKRRRESMKLTPRELAMQELQHLIDSNLAQTDRKLYYVRLTAIVRCYIEGTTTIRAPELTTEEFLREISSTASFPSELKVSLKAFLESADLVKFAGQNPTEQDLASSAQRARDFIDARCSDGDTSR